MHEEVIIAETSQSHLSSALNPSLLKMGPLVITTVGAIAAAGTIIGASIAIGILTVTTTKSPPTCTPDRYTTYKSSKYLLDVLYNDYDIKGSNLYVKDVRQPINNNGIIKGNNTIFGNRIQYTSDLAYGNITFNYTVTNGWLDSTCEVFIDQKNNKPEAKDFSISIPKNRPYTIDVTPYVKDIDQDPLFLLNPLNNSLLFQYPGSPVGIYIKDYAVSDGIDQANAHITINTYNMRPKALGSTFILRKDYMYDLPISMNDYDPDGDRLTIVDVYNICPDANVFLEGESLVRFVPTRNNILILNGCPFQYTISDGSDISTGMAFVRLLNQKPQILSKKVYVPKNTVTTIPIETLDLDPYDLITIISAKEITSQLDIQFLIIDELTLIIPYMNGSDTILLNKRTYGLIVQAGIKDLNISIIGTDGYDTGSGNIEVIIENSKPICQNYTLICIKGNICYFDNSQLCLDPDGDTLQVIPITTSFIADSNVTLTVLAIDVMGATGSSQLLIIAVDPPHIKNRPLCHNSSISADRNQLIQLSKLLNITTDGTYILQKDGEQISDVIQVPYYPGNHSWQITISDGSLLNMCILLIYIPNNSPSCLSLNIQIPYNPQGTNIVIDTYASDPDGDPIVLLYSTPYCILNSNTLQCKIYTSTNIPITIQDMYGATGLCMMSITTILVPPVAMDDSGQKDQQSLSIVYTSDLLSNDYDPAGFPIQLNNTWFLLNGCSCVGCCDTNSGSKPVLDSTGKIITFYPNTNRCGTMKFQYRIDRVGNLGSAVATATYKIINCQCKKPMDIVLVWDGSSSISSSSWKSMKSFATNLASKMTISPSLVRMAVIQFSSSIYTDTPYGFGFQSDLVTLNNYLAGMKLKGGSTNIRYGLSAALIWLLNSGRSVDKTIVLITDGDSNQPTDCADCDLITTMGMLGSDWCLQRILNSTGKSYTCDKCDTYTRSCVDPTPLRLIIENLGINLVALGIGDSISSVGLQDLVVLNGGSLLSVSWNSLDSIYSLIADLSCT